MHLCTYGYIADMTLTVAYVQVPTAVVSGLGASSEICSAHFACSSGALGSLW